MRLLVDRGANPSRDIGARGPGDGEQLLCQWQGARERDGHRLRGDLAPGKVVACLERRILGRPPRHGSLQTGDLVLAEDDLDHAAPASASETRLDGVSRDYRRVETYRLRSAAARSTIPQSFIAGTIPRVVARANAPVPIRDFLLGFRGLTDFPSWGSHDYVGACHDDGPLRLSRYLARGGTALAAHHVTHQPEN